MDIVNSKTFLAQLLEENLDFHDNDESPVNHNFHSFPAKFPPQLPRKFINLLTQPGDLVLDPMSGSGTTILEALSLGRSSIATDIDPLALLLTSVKTAPLDPQVVIHTCNVIIANANRTISSELSALEHDFEHQWDKESVEFVNNWFAEQTKLELFALIREIRCIQDQSLRAFFEIAFSSTIITKSGGVSLAFDLGHTRPHKAKVVKTKLGEILVGSELVGSTAKNVLALTKTLRPALDEFRKKVQANSRNLLIEVPQTIKPIISFGNAQELPIRSSTIDLIVTSPPYASNAIDYMRAHKFSLVWMGNSVSQLSQIRKKYIGGEVTTAFPFEILPQNTQDIVSRISELDTKKGAVLHRYYSEMTKVLREMKRVLKPGKSAIVVVGSSIMRNVDTQTQNCLAEIGISIGLEVVGIGVRNLDRNRRMMPAGKIINPLSQIQQRMHQEYVIGFYKPFSEV